MVTSMGSRVFRDSVAEADSTQVARLRAAGAIVVGKTNTPEFGFTAITKNPLFGVTRSPLEPGAHPRRIERRFFCGGSSAALAGGVLPLVTSSDGGGSIRIPASFTGAFGLKPQPGADTPWADEGLGLRQHRGLRRRPVPPVRRAQGFAVGARGACGRFASLPRAAGRPRATESP